MDSPLKRAMGEVRRAAVEYEYQWHWMVQQNRENKTLAYARVWLELALAHYLNERKRVQNVP